MGLGAVTQQAAVEQAAVAQAAVAQAVAALLRWPCWMLLLLPGACSVSEARSIAALPVPDATRQVLLCTTAGWSSTEAAVQRLERAPDGGWFAVGRPIAATVGRSGLGEGRGLHAALGCDLQKREGDGRAPLGIFRLGTAFGYGARSPAGVRYPYRCATARDYFVDAAASPDYNSWQRIAADQVNEPKRRWSSFERMRLDSDVYEFGLVVEHNMPDPIPGHGSAIFVHVWSQPGAPTSGCTAMARSDLLEVLRWLRQDAEPVLVQVTERALLARLQLAR